MKRQQIKIAVAGGRDEWASELVQRGSSHGVEVEIENDPKAADAIVIQDGALAASSNLFTHFAPKSIVISGKSDVENINEWLSQYSVQHLVGSNGPRVYDEVLITALKMKTGDVFGIEKYLIPGTAISRGQVTHARDINTAIDDLLKGVDLAAYFAATRDSLQLAANEFVTNAVYNAPIDENNNPKYEHINRRQKIELTSSEYVDLAIGADEHQLAFSVTDRFGRLTLDKIIRHFVKCANNISFIDNKAGGAGAGIFLAFYMSNQYVINIDPGKQMECICILERNRSYRSYRTRITSFNYFIAKASKKLGSVA